MQLVCIQRGVGDCFARCRWLAYQFRSASTFVAVKSHHSCPCSYYDNMSAKQCHSKALSCSVNDTSLCFTQDEADEVYRLGNYEYSYYYRDAESSTAYAALHYGAWVLELTAHLTDVVQGKSEVNVHSYRHIDFLLTR